MGGSRFGAGRQKATQVMSENGGAWMTVLDTQSLYARLTVEVARIRRLGGFLSIAAIEPRTNRGHGKEAAAAVEALACLMAVRVRPYDIVGRMAPTTLCAVMPGADSQAAEQAARRFLSMAATVTPVPFALGMATAYGEIEGGADAAIEAVQSALGEAVEPGEIRRSESFGGGRPRLLVVDDDLAFAEALADAVCERGWAADACSDATEALARVRAPGCYGLFVDLVMPERSGAALSRESLRHFPGRPVILMSGHDTRHDDVIDLLSTGGPIMFIRKPIEPLDLERALNMFRLLLPGLSNAIAD